MLNLRWLIVFLLMSVSSAEAAPIIDQWPVIEAAYFSQRNVTHTQSHIVLNAPQQAENAAIVPFSFLVNFDQTIIKKVYVFTDANPILLTAILTPSIPIKKIAIDTRIRLEKSSMVRVLVEATDGELFMNSVAIRTPGGGCGGGAMLDEAQLRASAGKMKGRLLQSENVFLATGFDRAFVLNIKHPMRTGFERTFQGYYAKAWFIEHLDLSINEMPYLQAQLGPGISADPYLKFYFDDHPLRSVIDGLQVKAKDNEGMMFTQHF